MRLVKVTATALDGGPLSRTKKFLLAAIVVTALVVAVNAHAATYETPHFAPVNYWVGPVNTTTKMSFFIDFDIYMQSTTASRQPNAVGLYFQSCNGSPLKLNGKTRSLKNGESFQPDHDGPTSYEWTRPMGAPPAGHPVKLHLSFISDTPDHFCLNIFDRSELQGGRSVTIQYGMK